MVIFHSYVKLPEGMVGHKSERPRHIDHQGHVVQVVGVASTVVTHPVPAGQAIWMKPWMGIPSRVYTCTRGKPELVGGIPTPLKKIRVRQLGWWHSQLDGKIIQMFQSPPTSIWVCVETYYHQCTIWVNTHKSQLFWCSPGLQGFDPKPYRHVGVNRTIHNNI